MKLFINNIVLIWLFLITPVFAFDNSELTQLEIETKLIEYRRLRHEAEIKAIEAAHRLKEMREKYPEAAEFVRERLKEYNSQDRLKK